MSDPSDPSPLALLHHHHHQHRHHISQPPPSSPSSATGHQHPHHHQQQHQHQQQSSSVASAGAVVRDYRKGNWALHETLILITAKRLDDERRAGGGSGGSSAQSSPSSGGGAVTPRSAEQRWKWVENYCWRNGCLRSQNQCNDKWDNLLRDYKKVRDYEARAAAAATGDVAGGDQPSYWTMERHERKERNLPTNMAAEVFEALTDVLNRRAARRGNATPVSSRAPPHPHPPPPPIIALPPPSPPRLQQPPLNPSPSAPPSLPTPPPPPPPPPHPAPAQQPSVSAGMSAESSESEENDEAAAEPEAKRRRLQKLGSSVVRSATVLARTLLACEEKREQRHRELLELEERRLRLEEDRTEMRRQGFAGLISAVNNLSGSILALVADHRNGDAAAR